MRYILVVAALLLLLMTAVWAQDIRTDFDRSYDLSQFRTFHLATQQRTPQDALSANPIIDKRIAEALRHQLAANRIVESEQPQLLVAYYGALKERTQIRAYGWGRPYFGGGMGTINADHYSEGTLVVDLIDAKSQTLVWRGIMTGTVEPNRSRDKLEKSIAKLVARFTSDAEKQRKAAGK